MATMSWDLGGGERFRVGYRTPGLSGSLDPDGKMALACELGMEVVEPQIAEKEFPDDDVADALAAAAERAGVSVPSVGAFPQTTDPACVEQVEADMRRSVRIAETLGAGYVFILAPWPPKGIPQSETWTLFIDNLRRCADICAEADILLALEPEWWIGSVERLDRALRTADHDNLWANYDPTNLYLGGSDPLEAFDRFGDRIRSGHIKDGVFRTDEHHETPVGEGELDYEAIFRRIRERGKSIDMHIEHCSEADQVRAAAAHVRDVAERVFDA